MRQIRGPYVRMTTCQETKTASKGSTLEQHCRSLGSFDEKNCYKVSNDCLEALLCIEKELLYENVATRSVRLALISSNAVGNNLIPIISTCDQQNEKAIMCTTMRILANLTVPLECLLLLTNEDILSNPLSTARFKQVHRALLNVKNSFIANTTAMAQLVKIIRSSFGDHDNCTESDTNIQGSDEFMIANNCLVLMRNLLHVPDRSEFSIFLHDEEGAAYKNNLYAYENTRETTDTHIKTDTDSQPKENYIDLREEWQGVYRKLVWNFLAHGFDGALLSLMNNKRRHLFAPVIVQLITLLFKDQHVAKLQALLTTGNQSSDNSEDDIESDSSSSIQHSSSSSILSDSSSEREYHKTCDFFVSNSDSGCPHSGLNDSTASSTATHAPTLHLRQNTMTALESSSTEDVKVIQNRNISENQSIMITNNAKNREIAQLKSGDMRTESNDIAHTHFESSEGFTDQNVTEANEEKRNTRAEQTSGISNGSSEEEQQMRVLRKVIKPHQRSTCTCQASESDSSDDSKTVRRNYQRAQSVRKLKLQEFLPPFLKTKCSPSICMEAALTTAHALSAKPTNSNSKSPCNVVAPWDKKKVSGSKKFPLGLESYVPTDEDIGILLRDFVFKFLHNSFTNLASDLKEEVMVRSIPILDQSHFLWLLSYFIKLAVAIDLEYHHISHLLSPKMFGFLVYQGVILNEELEILSTKATDLKSMNHSKTNQALLLRKMHLVVSAVRELIYVVVNYSRKRNLAKCDRDSLKKLRYELGEMADLRQLLLLYIRSFVPTVHSKQFLVEVIITNHILLLLLEPIYLENKFDLPLHLKQFATTKIMEHYGKILQDFQTNSDFVNDCVFTLVCIIDDRSNLKI